MKVLIIGAGGSGCALAVQLPKLGHEVLLYAHPEHRSNFDAIEQAGGLVATGQLAGFHPVVTTTDLDYALELSEFIYITVPSTGHASIIDLFAKHDVSRHIFIVIGANFFTRIASPLQARAIVELSASPYVSRSSGSTVEILGLKTYINAAVTGTLADGLRYRVNTLFSMPVRWRDSPLEVGLYNLNGVLHPITTIALLPRIESGDALNMYCHGIGDAEVAALIEEVDQERLAIGKALGYDLPSTVAVMNEYYGTNAPDMVQLGRLLKPHNERALLPASKNHRYLTEDVPYVLIPWTHLARALDVPTPRMDFAVDKACALNETDYRATGRSAAAMGLAGFDRNQILNAFGVSLCTAPSAPSPFANKMKELYRWTMLFDAFAWRESDECIRETNRAVEIASLRSFLDNLSHTTLLPRLPFLAKWLLNSNVRAASQQLDIWRAGRGLPTNILFTFFVLLMTVLPLLEAGLLNERVYIVRNFPYFLLFLFEQLRYPLWRHNTLALHWRMYRDRLATVMVTTLLYIAPAFVPSLRYLYDTNLYTILNITLSAIWLFIFQYSADVFHHSILVYLRSMPRAVGEKEQAAILSFVAELEKESAAYENFMRLFDNDSILRLQDGMQRERLAAIKAILLACLPKDVRSDSRNETALTPSQSSQRAKDRQIKFIFSIFATGLQLAVIISVWTEWLSVAQTSIYFLNVVKILWAMALQDSQSVERFFDIFNRMIIISLLTFMHVSVPLFKDKDIFDSLPFSYATCAAVSVEYILLPKVLVASLVKSGAVVKGVFGKK
ncbi:hypothetical protein BKA70DRAFT_860719 [Coprinopsis sp. MPI-PUGE-AT-0042]|nr:hypothetical protein BKA70DRAFT_860719 [Coprinopsis sp. MPI-PUGE-AT-0042]